MKPIHLDITGLNSFRGKASIDFEPLLRDGLFGIFGPTGSGKSTILDAITLALYGIVPRSGSKGNFINERENECSVAFTFQISDGADRSQYTVERHFRRNKTGGTEARKLRLSEHDAGGNPVPIAEKARELTERVQEILGINADDFLRAVVLPQGAFADFLSLKPTERSRVLERLFNLEHLGECLTKTLRARRDEISGTIRIVEERLAMLAEHNDDAVAELENKMNAAEAESSAASASADKATDALHQGRDLFKLITERHALLQEEDERQRSRVRVEQIAGDLDRADRTRSLLPLIDAAEAGEKKRREAEQLHDEMRAALDQVSSLAERAARALEEIAPQELERLALLEDQRRELEGIRKTNDDLREQRATLQQSEAVLATLKEELRKLEEEATADAGAEAALREDMEKLRGEERANAITEAERKRITDLNDALKERRGVATSLGTQKEHYADEEKSLVVLQRTIDDKSRDHADSQRLAAEQSQAVASLERTLADLTQKADTEKERAAGLVHGINELERLASEAEALVAKESEDRRRLNERKRDLTRLETQGEKARVDHEELEENLATMRAEYERAAHQVALVALSKSLHNGVDCPLCGSLHHPSPFHERPKDPAQGIGALSKEGLQDLETRSKKAAELLASVRSEYRARRDEMKGMETALDERTKELQEKKTTLADRLRALLADDEEQTIDRARARRQEEERQVKALSDEIESLTQRLKEKTEDQNTRTASIQALEVGLASDGGLLNEKKRNLKREADAIAADTARLKKIDQVIAQRATKGDLKDAEREVVAFRARDARLQEVRAKIEESRRQMDELANKRRVGRDRRDEVHRQYDRREGDVTQLHKAIDERDREVRSVLARIVERDRQEVLIDELITDIAAEIDRLKKKIDQRKNDLQQSQVNRARAEQDFANAESNLKRAANDVERERGARDAALLHAGYSSGEAARKDALDDTELGVLRNELQTLKTGLEIARKRIEELDQNIGDRAMSKADLDRLESEDKTLRQASDECRKQVNVLDAQMETARVKNAQWRTARDQMGKEGEQAKRYERLERYLRGNGFVNYVANEHLTDICRRATRTLAVLTAGRYEVMARGKDGFVIGDNRLGGERYPGTLSGGETFLVSLALALALSDTLQFERRPLEFFFLDEGFGSLDAELLETVIDALERLASPRRAIGVISHLTTLRERIEHKLIVDPSIGVEGSRVQMGDVAKGLSHV